MSILNNTFRHGNFTSSEIVALTSVGTREMTEQEFIEHKKQYPKSKKKNIADGFGKPALTYIEEKNMERRLGRSLTTESNAKPLVWGKFVEGLVFDLLGMAYSLCSTETILHPVIDCWSGTPDATKTDTVCDIKSPFTLKSFCQLVQPLYDGLEGMDAMNKIRENHNDGEKFYYQLVSNSILTGSKYAELIVYVPYQSEIEVIKQMADGDPTAHFINWAAESELPYLIEGGYYKNINVIRFEVPQEDKEFLTQCVLKAKELLYKEPSVILAELDSETNTIIVS